MKKLIILIVILATIPVGGLFIQAKAFDRFPLTPDQIREAIRLGRTSDLKFNEFGDYDIGLNRFNFGEGIGYAVILTPFVEIATVAGLKKISQDDFNYRDADKLINYPPQVRVYLYTNKQSLKSKVDCLVITARETVVLRSNIKESTVCDEATNKCVRKLVFDLPINRMQNVSEFTLLVINTEFAQRKIKINLKEIK